MKHLHQNQPQQKRRDWANVWFAAEASSEPFDDVTIVTLKSHFIEVATEKVARHMDPEHPQFASFVVKAMDEIVVCEGVEVSNKGIKVILNVEQITDDCIYGAMDFLAEALDLLEGHYGTVEFGQPTSFETTELPLLYQH